MISRPPWRINEPGRKSSTTIVACEVLVPELQAALAPWPRIQVISLPAALHTDMDRLEKELDHLLSTLRLEDCVDLHILYGKACSPSLDQVVQKYDAVSIEAGNCLDAFLGPLKKEAEAENAFVLTPGWIRAWPAIMKSMGWDEVDSRTNLGRYDKAVLFDAGIQPLTEEEILWFFDVSGLYVEIRPLDLNFFQNLLIRSFRLEPPLPAAV